MTFDITMDRSERLIPVPFSDDMPVVKKQPVERRLSLTDKLPSHTSLHSMTSTATPSRNSLLGGSGGSDATTTAATTAAAAVVVGLDLDGEDDDDDDGSFFGNEELSVGDNHSFSENSSLWNAVIEQELLENSTTPQIQIQKEQQRRQQRTKEVSFYSDLTFEDAKQIWLREEKRARSEANHDSFAVSKFDDDLDKSLREQQDQQQLLMDKSLREEQQSVASTTEEDVSTTSDDNDNEDNDDNEDAAILVSADVTNDETKEPQHQHHQQEQSSRRAAVRFGDIFIQEYPMIPGVNPGVSRGVPITIAWEHFDTVQIDFEMYEKWREPHRRCMSQMRLPASQREFMLRGLGFTRMDMLRASKQATVIRNQRIKCNSLEHLDKALHALEKTSRGIKNVLTLGRRKRKEQKYLTKYVPSYQRGDSKKNLLQEVVDPSNDNLSCSCPASPTVLSR